MVLRSSSASAAIEVRPTALRLAETLRGGSSAALRDAGTSKRQEEGTAIKPASVGIDKEFIWPR